MNKIIIAGLFFLFSLNNAFAKNDTVAYITNAASPSSISFCHAHPLTGQLEACESLFLEHLSSPLDIALAHFENNTYAYITNSNYPAVVTRCEVESKGQLHGCVLTDVPSYSGITFHESNALYAYLSHNASVLKCKVSKEGYLEQQYCSDSGAGPIFTNGPIYIIFKTFHENTYAYIANGDYKPHASVTQCTVTALGDFTHCIDSGAGTVFNGAADIDFATISGRTYAYITESGGAIAKCEVSSQTGLLNNCTPTGGQFDAPIGMTIKKIAGKLYAYIVDGGFHTPPANAVSQCTINSSGDFECIDAGAGSVFANPFGILLRNSL